MGQEAGMTEDERRRFESLEMLRAAAYKSFNDRRGHEWRFCLSIWTTLTILLAGLVQPAKIDEAFPLKGQNLWVVVVLIGFAIIGLQTSWNSWASGANTIDNKIQFHFREAMINMVNLKFDNNIEKLINDHRSRHNPPCAWAQSSHLVQVLITTLLVLAVVLIVYVRSAN
jgi:hypothetical protein